MVEREDAGRRAAATAGVADAGEEGDSGGFVRAAQATKASGKGREGRREREEAGGEVSHLFRTLEEATHLGGFQPIGRRLCRRCAALWAAGAVRGCSSVSGEDDGASRRAFGRPEEDLVRPSSACGG